MAVNSCYIHIPFCDNICSYCDFCKMYYNSNLVDKYLLELEREIDSKYKGEVLNTIYIGGGTPSSLNIKQLNKLFSIINKLNKSNNCEYTIEGNFNNTTKEKLDLYKKYGINRLSFGIESINQDNLKFLNRELNINEVKNIIDYSKSIGLNNINLDLIYALPKEDINILNNDIDFILSLNVNHISTYSLMIEDNTKLKIDNIENIDEELDYLMYKNICKKLSNYNHYEISNFCKDGFESKHNLCYWNNDYYYGFGLGASSYIDNIRSSNTKSLTNYLKGDYILEKEELNIDDVIEYEIMLKLRLKDGINLKVFKDKYSKELIDLYDYSILVDNKLLILDNDNLFIPEDKFYISNEIIVKLLQNKI
ncbi:MAG: radical SAM family heme chaperone HemW [Bacilli bacterium]|nr:radical SAM family heme chaperone HemW [Bacilli bacterium]